MERRANLTIKLPSQHVDILKKEAWERGCPMGALVIFLIEAFLNRSGNVLKE